MIDGVVVAVQLDIKSTYADGSARMAVLAVERPELLAGRTVHALLIDAPAPAPQPALNLLDELGRHAFSIGLIDADGQLFDFDVLAALRSEWLGGRATEWQDGALASQARIEVDLPGSMRAVFDVTVFKGGGLSVEAQFNNDQAMQANGGRASYRLFVDMDGQRASYDAVDQGQYQNWHRSYSSNGRDGGQGLGDPAQGWLNIRHDIDQLQDSGAVARYDLAIGVEEARLVAWGEAAGAAGWDAPLASNGLRQYMPGPGGRDDIGFTTAANAAWLMSQDARAADYAMGQAESAGAVPWNMWDSAHGTWLSTDDYVALWTDPRGGVGVPGNANSTGLTQQPDDSGWTPDTAHQPDASYVPYLLTGERWMLDNLNAQASYTVVSQWPVARGDGLDLVVRVNQVRGAAWSLRQIDEAAWISPDGSREKAY
ncbi:MAG: hypothetical protein H7Z19_20320, partial [Chitinophagaceae bacterium]|nr:hypothetical protein [Rubrivivax sp.]